MLFRSEHRTGGGGCCPGYPTNPLHCNNLNNYNPLEGAEEPAGARASGRNSRSAARRTPKQQKAARNELRAILSPLNAGKKGKKSRKLIHRKASCREKVVLAAVTCALRRFTTQQLGPGRTEDFMGYGMMSRRKETSHQGQM